MKDPQKETIEQTQKSIKNRKVSSNIDLEGDVLVNKEDLEVLTNAKYSTNVVKKPQISSKKSKILIGVFSGITALSLASAITVPIVMSNKYKSKIEETKPHEIQLVQPEIEGWHLSCNKSSAVKGEEIIFYLALVQINAEFLTPAYLVVNDSAKFDLLPTPGEINTYYCKINNPLAEKIKVGIEFKKEASCKVEFSAEHYEWLSFTTVRVKTKTLWRDVPKPTYNLPLDKEFVGWYLNDQPISDDQEITQDTTIVFKTKTVTVCDINFLAGPNGKLYGGQTSLKVKAGTKWSDIQNKPIPLADEFYHSTGYYDPNDNFMSNDSTVSSSGTYTAKFEQDGQVILNRCVIITAKKESTLTISRKTKAGQDVSGQIMIAGSTTIPTVQPESWQKMDYTTSSYSKPYKIPKNTSLILRGYNYEGVCDENITTNINITGDVSISGTITGLMDGGHEDEWQQVPSSYCYAGLFKGATGISEISDTFLPFKQLQDHCYESMFEDCRNLQTLPALPAEEMKNSCYKAMFKNCERIESIPDDYLKSLTLAPYCYDSMFYGLKSLEEIPEQLLKAEQMTEGCYQAMFNSCSSLDKIPDNLLNSQQLANKCYASMFASCKALSSGPSKLIAKTLSSNCYADMFAACSNLRQAPEILAETTAEGCFQGMYFGASSLETVPAFHTKNAAKASFKEMFSNCDSLKNAPSLAEIESMDENCFSFMFLECKNLETLPTLPSCKLADFCYSEMFSGCTNIKIVPENYLNNYTLAQFCYEGMFSDCLSLTQAPKLSTTTLTNGCYERMFQNCISLETMPALPALELKDHCYASMFEGCISLTTVSNLLAETIKRSSYEKMFKGCASLEYAPIIKAKTFAYETIFDVDHMKEMFADCVTLYVGPSKTERLTVQFFTMPQVPASDVTYYVQDMFKNTLNPAVVTPQPGVSYYGLY